MRKVLIGSGSFTRVYVEHGSEEEVVEVISICPTKEAYSFLSQGNKFAPVIEQIGPNRYKMPLYPSLRWNSLSTSLNERALTIYNELNYFPDGLNYFEFCNKVNNSTVFTEEEKEALVDLAGDVGNFLDPEDMRYELACRNLTFTPAGDLILLDCFYSNKLLWEVRGKDSLLSSYIPEGYPKNFNEGCDGDCYNTDCKECNPDSTED